MPDVLERLAEAIKEAGMTESVVAEKLGIHRVTLNRYLNGHTEMPAQVFIDLLQLLDLRLDDFTDSKNEMKVLFRSDYQGVHKKPFFKHTIDRFHFYSTAIESLNNSLPEVTLPKWRHIEKVDEDEIEEAALETRRVLRLPERGPLPNFFNNLGRVVKVLEYSDTLDNGCQGFTVSSEAFGTGVAVNRECNVENQRSTLAHELGHIVLHPDSFASPDNAPKSNYARDPREQAAKSFGGHFLLPSLDLRDLFAGYIGRKGASVPIWFIYQVKKLYGVSALLVLVRLLKEQYITGKQFGFLKKTIYGGNEMEEPLPLIKDEYGSLQEHFEVLVALMYFGGELSESRLSELLDRPEDEIQTWLNRMYPIYGSESVELAS